MNTLSLADGGAMIAPATVKGRRKLRGRKARAAVAAILKGV